MSGHGAPRIDPAGISLERAEEIAEAEFERQGRPNDWGRKPAAYIKSTRSRARPTKEETAALSKSIQALLAEKKSLRAIASALGVSENTVLRHKNQLRQKAAA